MKKCPSCMLSCLLIATVMFSGCTSKSYSKPVLKNNNETESNILKSILPMPNSDFAFRLMNQTNSEQGGKNIVLSPLSLSLILCLTQNGASGETKNQILNTLGISGVDDKSINEEYKKLIGYYNNIKSGTLKTADSIWIQNGIAINKNFINTAKEYYNSETNNINFSSASAPKTINNWVSKNTNGKIKEIVKNFDEKTWMVLINSLYFKGRWVDEFKKQNTSRKDFTLSNGSKIKVDMMQSEKHVSYLKGKDFKAVALPYYNDISMYIFLPDDKSNIKELITGLNEKQWNDYMGKFQNDEVKLQIPKFKVEYGEKLADTLRALGMKQAFDSKNANLEGIAKNAYISDITQKCYVSVDEEGTEAAAITAELVVGSALPKENPAEVIVNRPFLFVIRDDKTGVILFMGKIEKPE